MTLVSSFGLSQAEQYYSKYLQPGYFGKAVRHIPRTEAYFGCMGSKLKIRYLGLAMTSFVWNSALIH